MACPHNVMIRYLNAIYLQGPHIRAEQQQPFLYLFTELWYKSVEQLHRIEDNIFLPIVEEMTGEEGIMQVDTERHDAFLLELEAFVGYELVRLIDSFAPALWKHLGGIHVRFVLESEKTHQEFGLLAGTVFLMGTHNIDYEKGIHKKSSLVPAPIVWELKNLAWWAWQYDQGLSGFRPL
ncbi:hypothetical protein GGR53DRAFT_524519 [Hypoxylon sp. FL1150]|nr:hypothetical protein GGR53DRAFT_524519 [Hypoxylon sp. FL1150]